MDLSLRFRINAPDVVQEVFDDEVIVVNLRAGAYYTLSGTGAVIWKAIEHSASMEEILGQLGKGFRGDAATIRAATESLMKELEAEALIIALPAGAPSESTVPPVDPPTEPPAFEPPQLTKYTDMRDLLILDPIHDVDESGWPARRD